MKTLGQLWSRKLFSTDPNYITKRYWMENVPLLICCNLPTGRFRVFIDGDVRFDVTPLMKHESLQMLSYFLDQDLGGDRDETNNC